eukprot:GCRY01004075.1.p1 GENE.GCRY01004075.1~~GCRY01004075.1.p1  ORF type:complete len:240 (-),score=55.79 GCRY01004075.1:249-968(-)
MENPDFEEVRNDLSYSAGRPYKAAGKEFLRWYDAEVLLEGGSSLMQQLRAPRLRMGPNAEHPEFHPPPSDTLYKGDRDREVDKALENMRKECAVLTGKKHINLSYQDLGDPYQATALKHTLDDLKTAEEILLGNNRLSNLSAFSFPQCKVLHLGRNNIPSFAHLPAVPLCAELVLCDNLIKSLTGSKRYRKVKVLSLRGNPIFFLANYKALVAKAFPELQKLDGNYFVSREFLKQEAKH